MIKDLWHLGPVDLNRARPYDAPHSSSGKGLTIALFRWDKGLRDNFRTVW